MPIAAKVSIVISQSRILFICCLYFSDLSALPKAIIYLGVSNGRNKRIVNKIASRKLKGQSRATIHWADDSDPEAIVIPPIDIKKSLAVAAEKIGLPKLTRHMMRHTFATFLGSKGATDMDLMDLGGWKSVAMVRRYRKIVDERLDDVMDAFNENGEEQASER